ncbi:MAG: Na(+)/H(+) antiporter subunit D [Desulfobacterales bacterium]|jgi:multicomponent Na+:H+ antiporter subunit D|nr:Na(+)/H(+) antiporter subunit D [Desulfobacterales bacterium]
MTTDLYTHPMYSPVFLFFAAALLVPLLKGWIKSAMILLVPVMALWILIGVPIGSHWRVQLLDYELILGRVDRLSLVFGYIFTLISFIAVLFALQIKDDLQHSAGFLYAGSALGVIFAGDLLSLYIFWEIMAVASTFLILARRTPAARAAAFRYILVHVFGGLSLLAGIVMYFQQAGTLSFSYVGLKGVAAWLIFFGVAVNAAIPPLHPWLQDAYPEATVTGAVFLSAFTTKSAVYVMARMFPGTELLVWLGALMTVLPIFYAVLENDIRRVLAYSLINQVGFMMVGVGIGTPLALNGAVSHAFCHILYKALLFMSVGAVLHQTGRIRCTELGGLYKTMPYTCVCCLIGAASISAFPLFSGFVSKSMIISAAGHDNLVVIWLMLQFASAGVLEHAGIKVPYFTFFGEDAGIRTTEPPMNMRLAMGLAAFLCLAIGIYPAPLYKLLPYTDISFVPYTGAHVVGQLQLLMFGALAFCMLMRSGYFPAEMRSINLDMDWFYRKGGRGFYALVDTGLNAINRFCDRHLAQRVSAGASRFARQLPVYIAAWVLWCFQSSSTEANRFSIIKQKVQATLSAGAVPIGLSAAAAGLFMVLLFMLS